MMGGGGGRAASCGRVVEAPMLSVGAQSQKGLAPVVPIRTPIGGFCFFSRRLDPRLVGEAALVCLEVMVWRR